MIDKINYNKWFEMALAKQFTALEISIHENKEMMVSLLDGQIDENVQSSLATMTITGLYQDKKASMYLEKIDETKMEEVLELLKKQISVLNLKEKNIIFKGSEYYPEVKEYNFDFKSVNIQDKYDLLFQAEKELSKSTFLKKIDTISYSESYFRKRIINSEGLDLKSQMSYATIYFDGIFEKNEEAEVFSKYFTFKTFDEFDIPACAQTFLTLGEKRLGAKSLESKGNYPVVFSNEIFAKILNNFSSIFSGMSAYRNLTRLKDKEGEKIASSLITIVDDPLTEKAFFQDQFDDEGVACYTKTIVEKGIFKQFIHNLKTSIIFNTPPTGNSFKNAISMTNCYVKEGTKSLKEMISPIKEGVYIDFLIGLHAGINTINGDFSLQANGFQIENGKITTPVKMLIVSGNFFELLLNIKDIDNDLFFQISGFGSPNVYADDLTIAGSN
ncbi:TldD/PmbA family protein ['Camptotheca acuminata' phytoplasma]|uniref:TldD/PmbA family protein n=1 Tax='Camptotheca acuminata' phytoplasma TaxID=3239192 RepID=UPI00351A0B66